MKVEKGEIVYENNYEKVSEFRRTANELIEKADNWDRIWEFINSVPRIRELYLEQSKIDFKDANYSTAFHVLKLIDSLVKKVDEKE